jgi:hypothetical protein
MRHGPTGVALVCLVVAAAVAGAQEQTAAIVGVVRDSSGGVVPGASVTAAHAGGLSVHAVTDDGGRYRFPALPPGAFELTAELTGFAQAKVESVELRLGRRLDVDITLTQATLEETVRVVAESPLIAVTQSARAASLRKDEIEKLPNGRDFTDVVAQVAGANLEVDKMPWAPVSIDGSSGAENRFIIDGAESTDLVFGSSARPAVSDFLDEIQVKSSGYTPEYGGSTGGVINAVTKNGTNAWHGDALLYWEADWLDAGNAPTLQLNPQNSTLAEHVTFPKDDYHALEPGFTLGGPILRDRLWFFAGYLPRFEPIRRTAPFADGTTGTLLQYWKTHNAVASVTGQLGSHWRFRTSYNMGRVRREGLLQEENGSSAPDAAYDDTLIQPGWSLSASVDWIPSPSFYTSLRAAYSLSDEYLTDVYEGDRVWWGTSSVGLPGVPPEYQQPQGFENVPSNWGGDRERMGRLGVQWDSTFFFTSAGRHQLKAGVQLDRRTFDILLGNTGNVHEIYWDQAFDGQRGDFGYYLVVSNPVLPNRGSIVVGDAQVNNFGLFVQDAWTIGDRLTLHLGLRTENEDVPSFSRDPSIPETAINFGFGDKLAPRLGFAWDVAGDGRTKVYGSWGIFYDIMKLRLPAGFGAQFWSVSWYTLDSSDLSQIQDTPACPPECPGRLIQHRDILTGSPINDPDNPEIQIAPGLEPMKLQEAVIGVEREIGQNLSVSARYIHKQLDRAVEDVGFLDEAGSQSFTVANPGFGAVADFVPRGGTSALPYPKARRDYDAVEIGVERRMANGWAGRFSYLWSRLHGSYSGLANSDFLGSNPNFTFAFSSPMMSFDENARPVYGPLGSDRTHQIKGQLIYDFAFGTAVGASWLGSSGVPVTRWAQFTPGFFFSVFYQGREGDGRMPFVSRLDLQVQHRLRLGERLRLTLTATAFNLFNQNTPTDAWSQELFFGQAVDVPETEFFEGVDTRALIEEQGLVIDPRFLMDRTFQAPRTIRLAARLSF